jgi:hypothetical protein
MNRELSTFVSNVPAADEQAIALLLVKLAPARRGFSG